MMPCTRLARWIVVAVAIPLAASACAAPRDDVDDLATITWLDRARHAHDAADSAIARHDEVRAHQELSAALERELPPGLRLADARIVRQDLCFRLSQLELRRKDPRAALSFADRGLALGKTDDLFTSNLLIARGQAQQALTQPTEAATSYHDALQINERLLRATLAGDAAKP